MESLKPRNPVDEKRKSRRFDFREAVEYYLADSPVCQGAAGCDLSQGGVRFRANDFIPLTSNLILNVFLKPEKIVRVEGTVVWVQQLPHEESYHIGCEFKGSRHNIFPISEIRKFLELESIPIRDHDDLKGVSGENG
mgnify:CR=1 FL=1